MSLRPTRLDQASLAAPARALLITGLLLGGAACSHEQPPPAETIKPLPARASNDTPRARARNQDVARREDGPAAPSEPAVYFDFDSSQLRPEDQAVLQQVAENFRDHHAPSRSRQIRIEGNCDDLGTTEYNLALGEHRARAAKEYLIHLGVPDNHIATISYGSTRPKYPDDDAGRAKNRRDDVIIR